MLTTKLMTTEEFAAKWDVHPATVRKWCIDGLIPALRLPGGQYRIDPDAKLVVKPKQEPA